MPAPRKYPPELRERAMRLVAEARKEDPELSLNAAVVRVGQRVGVNADTLRGGGASRPRSTPANAPGPRRAKPSASRRLRPKCVS